MNRPNDQIIYYDGDCGFCNKSVQFILKNKSSNSFLFSALQSDFAINNLKQHGIPISLETIYYQKGDKIYDQSSAIIQIAKLLQYPYKLIILSWIIPKLIRDFFYRMVANNRHRLNKGFCIIPSENEKSLFIN